VRNLTLLFSFLLFFILCASFSWAESKVFNYDVSWLGIPAGKIKITVKQRDGRTKLIAKARTIGLVRVLLPFESTWTTWLDKNGYPRRSRILRIERGKKTLKEYIYDQQNGVVEKYRNGKHEKTIKLKKYPVHDELSAFYASMGLCFKAPGEEKSLLIFAKNKANEARLKYLKDEKEKTPCGRLKAKKIAVTFGFQSELIERSKKALLWVAQNMVVKGEGKLTLGHITAKLSNCPSKEEKSK